MLHGKEYFPFKDAFVMKLDIDFAALKVVRIDPFLYKINLSLYFLWKIN